MTSRGFWANDRRAGPPRAVTIHAISTAPFGGEYPEAWDVGKRNRVSTELIAAWAALFIEARGRLPLEWSTIMHRAAPPMDLLTGLRTAPGVMPWLEAGGAFRAPRLWPEYLAGRFPDNVIPSPFEVGALSFRGMVSMNKIRGRDLIDLLALKLYCMGVSEELYVEWFEVTPKVFQDRMVRAVGVLSDIPAFFIWATATDFYETVLLPQMWRVKKSNPKRRGQFLNALQTNVFSIRPSVIRPWTESPLIRQFLIHLTAKRPRVGYYPREFLVRPPYAREAEDRPEEEDGAPSDPHPGDGLRPVVDAGPEGSAP